MTALVIILVIAGVLPMQYFASALTQSSLSLLANLPLVTKVYFPRLLAPIGTGFLYVRREVQKIVQP